MIKIIKFLIYLFALIGFVLTGGYFLVKFGLTNSAGVIDDRFLTGQMPDRSNLATSTAWRQSEEWQVLKEAVQKDALLINQVANLTDVSPRLLVAQLIVEQLRLFTSEREVYKQIFAPLKILGNQSQFSWGVVGLKEDTAKQIENNLKDKTSPYYLGPRFETILDYPATVTDINAERFNRIANTDNGRDHYYAYLYAALYLKQIEVQWERVGFHITDRPEILSTLYNIGFTHSKPNTSPQVGGAEIEINSTKYSFGGLAYEFYWSDEMLKEFPR